MYSREFTTTYRAANSSAHLFYFVTAERCFYSISFVVRGGHEVVLACYESETLLRDQFNARRVSLAGYIETYQLRKRVNSGANEAAVG